MKVGSTRNVLFLKHDGISMSTIFSTIPSDMPILPASKAFHNLFRIRVCIAQVSISSTIIAYPTVWLPIMIFCWCSYLRHQRSNLKRDWIFYHLLRLLLVLLSLGEHIIPGSLCVTLVVGSLRILSYPLTLLSFPSSVHPIS